MMEQWRRRIGHFIACTVLLLNVGVTARTVASENKTSLWKVTSSTSTVYLLGSIHLLTESDYPLAGQMEHAFESADIVVCGADPDSLDSPELQMYLLKNAMYEEGRTLKTEFGDSVYAFAQEKAESLGVNLDEVATFRPWFVSLAVTLAEMQRLGFDPALGVEMHFGEKAKSLGKKVLALETARYQMDLFITLSDKQQQDYLVQTLMELSEIEKELLKIVKAWKAGDLEELQRTLNKSFKEYPDIYDKLVTQRNKNWVDHIVAYLSDDKNYLVIVGVGHMPGDEGLIRLLEKKGLKIEQL